MQIVAAYVVLALLFGGITLAISSNLGLAAVLGLCIPIMLLLLLAHVAESSDKNRGPDNL